MLSLRILVGLKELNRQGLAHNEYQMLTIIIHIKKKVPCLPGRCNSAGHRAWQVEWAKVQPLPQPGTIRQYMTLQPDTSLAE